MTDGYEFLVLILIAVVVGCCAVMAAHNTDVKAEKQRVKYCDKVCSEYTSKCVNDRWDYKDMLDWCEK